MGPFSEYVYEEIEFLLSLNAIESEPLDRAISNDNNATLAEKRFSITPKGQKIASELEKQLEAKYRQELRTVVDTYNRMALTRLLEYVYREYPSFAAESEILDELDVESGPV
ncbi:unknown (plasmid) [Haloarcula marismortui ATCC 43049]|uniref:Uncharacterized protein n=2 Tax=Haloarcula marismortui TaxID=2238 RepID=Q5V7T5_HALMA|nr:unknown [Haloarcula marismortui ATCC 43049]